MYDKPPARDAPNVLTHVQNDAESDSRVNHAMLSSFGAIARVVLAARHRHLSFQQFQQFQKLF